MSKAVMISIRPEWCEKIASGQKTIEVRKTKPKLDTPFTCYIYQTRHKWICSLLRFLGRDELATHLESSRGKVIGEFVCDRIYDCDADSFGLFDINTKEHLSGTCLVWSDIWSYSNGFLPLYGWHISDLVIYDKPKELSEFISFCSEYDKKQVTAKCHKCEHFIRDDKDCYAYCEIEGEKSLTRSPQSWCYVEGLE